MPSSKFPGFLMELPPPLGYKGLKIEPQKLKKIIYCLNIRDHEGRTYFPEALWAIFHSIMGNNDEKVANCETVLRIMKTLKKTYNGLGKTVTHDIMCGYKYYKNEMTVYKYLYGMVIFNGLKKLVKKRKMREAGIIDDGQNQDDGTTYNLDMSGLAFARLVKQAARTA